MKRPVPLAAGALVVAVMVGVVGWGAIELLLDGPVIRVENPSAHDLRSGHVIGDGFVRAASEAGDVGASV